MSAIGIIHKTFEMNEQCCDEIADLVSGVCNDVGADSKDALRYRLSAEECLLYWLNHGFEGRKVTFTAGKYMFSNFFNISIDTSTGNPYLEKSELFGTYCDSILVSLHLNPEYSVRDHETRIRFKVKKAQRGQITRLLMVMAFAIAFGLVGLMLPDGIRSFLLETVITPIYDTFFKILGCVAGPMIFLSVAWGVYGIGDTATLGQIGKKMLLKYTGLVFLVTAFTAVFYPVLGPELSETSDLSGQLSAISELVLGIFPANIIEPFTSGNTLQIILLAIVIGIALLYLGRQTSAIARAIEQINLVVQFLMEVVSRLVPYMIFLIVVSLIWSGNIASLNTMWKLILSFFVMVVAVTLGFLIYTSIRYKVSIITLIHKSMPAFLVGITTASSAAVFSINVSTCEKKYGIDNSLVDFGIPLGMVINKPVSGIINLMLAFYFMSVYDISCSFEGIIAAVFVSAVVAIATPPIPGGGAAAYAMLYNQLGIPDDALAMTLALDMLLDFAITAFTVVIIQYTLIDISAGMGMIDKDVLRS